MLFIGYWISFVVFSCSFSLLYMMWEGPECLIFLVCFVKIWHVRNKIFRVCLGICLPWLTSPSATVVMVVFTCHPTALSHCSALDFLAPVTEDLAEIVKETKKKSRQQWEHPNRRLQSIHSETNGWHFQSANQLMYSVCPVLFICICIFSLFKSLESSDDLAFAHID